MRVFAEIAYAAVWVVVGAAIATGLHDKPAPVLPPNPEGTTVEFLGATPEGVKLYRLTGPRTIVPQYIQVAR